LDVDEVDVAVVVVVRDRLFSLAMVYHSVLFTVRRAALSSFAASTIYTNNDRTHGRQTSLLSLIRAYAVYTLCSVPFIVDNSSQIFKLLRTVPVASHITDALVRVTFFDQFVGGDSALQTLPLLRQLRSQNNGALLAFSVESDESDRSPNRPYKRIVNEIIHCIDVAADFEDTLAGTRKTWVALKMTALLPDPNALVALSAHIIDSRPTISNDIAFPGRPAPHDLDVLSSPRLPETNNVPQYLPALTQADITALRELHADLVNICTRAQKRGVRLVVDAEYSWYQPAIDSFTYSLMRQFNKLPSDSDQGRGHVFQPLVYTTFQAYLKS
jgi:proline dehydrogenase